MESNAPSSNGQAANGGQPDATNTGAGTVNDPNRHSTANGVGATKAAHGRADDKLHELDANRETATGQYLTTNDGLRYSNDQDSLKAGERGPTLLEDFVLREKIHHFDHERIPERVVHARGAAAHGYFEAYGNAGDLTKAHFLQAGQITPLFTRMSTVVGSRGSADTVRDVHGFAVKMYTQEGIFDLVGNNIPIFFIQDATKFPDFIHAVKPEPRNEMPQAASAHDTFYDFISSNSETTAMLLWVMSDRGIPRSLRMMEGFGVHTFRLINAAGTSCFVKFHWKPLLGVHSLVWDEAQQIAGQDADFHRRDLWNTIESGGSVEWELGVQVVEEKDELSFDFDILDATKLIPEEQVPVRRIGKMTLNRNPDNYFAETEQVAFHLGHVVPGIDFSNDPLLQGRLFSYTDTQLSRLGTINFHEIPINRSLAPVHNNQRDGHMRMAINTGATAYGPNILSGGAPQQATAAQGGFSSYAEPMAGHKVRRRSQSFLDHYSQARLFWNSQSDPEKSHLVNALRFELSKVQSELVRTRTLMQLAQVDDELVARVAAGLGAAVPTPNGPLNLGVPADADPASYQSRPVQPQTGSSAALSMAGTVKDTIQTRQVAILLADGVNADSVTVLQQALRAAGAVPSLVAPRVGTLRTADGRALAVDFSLANTASVMFDAVYVADGEASVRTLLHEPAAVRFVNEAFRHCKALAAAGAGRELLEAAAYAEAQDLLTSEGVLTGPDYAALAADFQSAIAQHRFWSREALATTMVAA